MRCNFFGQIGVYTPKSQEAAERGKTMRSQQVALVTGASSGIGQATAELLASSGFVVFGTSRNPEKAARSYQWLSLDVHSDVSVEAAVQSLLDQAGRIDLLVNNAGYSQVGSIEESSIADTQAQFDTNVFGAMRMIKAILPIMRQQGSGRIINVSSVVGQVAPPYVGVYAASKFALEGLSEALRAEVRPFGIHVSMVEPAFVKTHITSLPPTNPLAIYTSGRLAATHLLATNLAKGMKPSVVARVILHAATTTQPRLRYLVGRDAKLLVALKRLLSGPLFERMGRRIFRAGTSPAQALPTHAQATATPD
jgi:NAD(P)-dependent dehydrogenase (short-subunit alcohol dehydrogenase family)